MLIKDQVNEEHINKVIVNQNISKNIIIIYSGPYDYKMFFEGKAYPHSVNLTKLLFNYELNNQKYSKILYISTGHSFAEQLYETDLNIQINKTNNIDNIFENTKQNIFYSLDNGFDDFTLISFGGLDLDNSNYFKFNNQYYSVNSICKNMNIKFLENEILLKNGHSTGEIYTKPIINFDSDVYLTTIKNNSTYYSFKINGKIIIILSKFSSGIVVKNKYGKLSKLNGEILSDEKSDYQFDYYFYNIIKDFSNHELFENISLNNNIKQYYKKYQNTDCLTFASLMGDSGSGLFRLVDNNNLEFVGTNIGGCSMIILSQNETINNNSEIYWNDTIGKLVFNKYIIEEVHKCCQILPIDKIQELIKKNISNNIQLTDITI